MRNHTKVYMEYFGYQIVEDAYCELCGKPCGPPHHIQARGLGGSKERDNIENLIGLCYTHHIDAEDHVYSKEYLTKIHLQFMKEHKI